jgi:hypothetical protein
MRSHAMRGRRLARGRRPRPSPLSIHYLSRGHLARQPCHQLRSFCLLYAAFRLNALLWNGGQHECRILVLNLDRYHCLWHLDCRWHDRRWLAFGLGAHGTAYRHCGFDQPLSSNSRSQNRVAEPRARASRRLKQRPGNGLSTNRSRCPVAVSSSGSRMPAATSRSFRKPSMRLAMECYANRTMQRRRRSTDD